MFNRTNLHLFSSQNYKIGKEYDQYNDGATVVAILLKKINIFKKYLLLSKIMRQVKMWMQYKNKQLYKMNERIKTSLNELIDLIEQLCMYIKTNALN